VLKRELRKVLTTKPGLDSKMKTLTKLLTTLKSTLSNYLKVTILLRELLKPMKKVVKPPLVNATSLSTLLDVST
jgi:hypothetical protein